MVRILKFNVVIDSAYIKGSEVIIHRKQHKKRDNAKKMKMETVQLQDDDTDGDFENGHVGPKKAHGYMLNNFVK